MATVSRAEAAALQAVLRIIGGELTNTREFDGWTPCPTCGRLAPPSIYGRPASCLGCTERECGEYLDELTARVSRRMAKARYYALLRDNDGKPILPALSYRDWRRLHA